MPIPSFFTASMLVALGGGLGAWLRYLVGLAWTAALGPIRAGYFPWSTLTVNLLGSLIMGVVMGWFTRHGHHGEGIHLFLVIGVMGGFTTFSSFSLDIVLMAQRGQVGLGMFYAGISVLAGIMGLVLGLSLMRHV